MTAYLRPFAELTAVALFSTGFLAFALSTADRQASHVKQPEMVVRSAHLEAGR